jgi:hypothetical protein
MASTHQGVRIEMRQTVSRFLSPEGLLIGITYAPAFRDKK